MMWSSEYQVLLHKHHAGMESELLRCILETALHWANLEFWRLRLLWRATTHADIGMGCCSSFSQRTRLPHWHQIRWRFLYISLGPNGFATLVSTWSQYQPAMAHFD